MGSPPRGRGKGIFAILALSATGITPAWAGKRCLNDLVDVDWQDHPRVGGEKEWTVHYHRQTEGSPPRGRGKGGVCGHKPRHHRITPAWAGKRSMTDMVRVWARDHPRVGGEKVAHTEEVSRLRGSPPRGRGKGPWRQTSPLPCGDHPRVGGEKVLAENLAAAFGGSPPRGRGKD